MTNEQDGLNEPGFTRFSEVSRRQGSTPQSIVQYARYIGAARKLAPKPLLELTVTEAEDLDLKLLERAPVLRTVVKMYYRAHKRADLLLAFPRQRRQKKPRGSLDDVLMPEDVMRLIAAADNKRDRALVSVLASAGARITETLSIRMRDIKAVNGLGYQFWIEYPKVGGQQRYTPKVEGAFKKYVVEFIVARGAASKDDRLFHDLKSNRAGKMLKGLRRKAGITKKCNPHWFRHSRITWGVVNKEDVATLSTQIWGIPNSPELNEYSHYSGLDTSIGVPVEIDLPDVPAFPVVPMQANQKHVAAMLVEMESVKAEMAARVAEMDAKNAEMVEKFLGFQESLTGRLMVIRGAELQDAIDAGYRVVSKVSDEEVVVTFGGKPGDPVTGSPVFTRKTKAEADELVEQIEKGAA